MKKLRDIYEESKPLMEANFPMERKIRVVLDNVLKTEIPDKPTRDSITMRCEKAIMDLLVDEKLLPF